jgi:hypothetical protein
MSFPVPWTKLNIEAAKLWAIPNVRWFCEIG